jgi:hypothetical protein
VPIAAALETREDVLGILAILVGNVSSLVPPPPSPLRALGVVVPHTSAAAAAVLFRVLFGTRNGAVLGGTAQVALFAADVARDSSQILRREVFQAVRKSVPRPAAAQTPQALRVSPEPPLFCTVP